MLRRSAILACVGYAVTNSALAIEPQALGHPPQVASSELPVAPSPSILNQELRLAFAGSTPASCGAEKSTRELAVTPLAIDAVCRLPEVAQADRGLPQAEGDFLVQPRWTKMPAFEIVEEPLPPPIMMQHPPVRPRPQGAPPVASGTAPRYLPPAWATAEPIEPSIKSPSLQLTHLTLPNPTSDPAAMVVELFEKLQAAEGRAAAARRRLAEVEVELASLRNQSRVAEDATGEVVLLEIRCFELDLDPIASSAFDAGGICKSALCEVGLGALAARGAFNEKCCSQVAQGPGQDTCNGNLTASCGTCQIAQGPGGIVAPSSNGSFCQFIQNDDRFENLLRQMEQSGLMDNVNRPRLMTRSGQTARMWVGRDIPYLVSTTTERGEAQSVSFVRAGTEIEVKPVINPDGTVQIELAAEWSTVDELAQHQGEQPTVSRRSITSMVVVPAGRTAVVAGLVQQKPSRASRRPVAATQYAVPVPDGDRVFRIASAEPTSGAKRSELVILITPKLIARKAPTAQETTAGPSAMPGNY